ncbi:MAG: hypothetical protein HC883_05500 [Bdellovibrionaceae bacterium]|nr:hypothetical protein [Pseudobdellovibrionaceae bacterium]
MRDKRTIPSGVQDLCRKLKVQLEELSLELTHQPTLPNEEVVRRSQLLERLKAQLAELSS